MKKIQKILFLLCFILFLLILKKKEKTPLVAYFPLSIFQIQSGSMMPEIQEKEIVILWKKASYQPQDIITYVTQDHYFVTHRIVKTTKEGYVTKGDWNNIEDKEIVKIEQIQGKVIVHSKLLGKVYQYRFYLFCIFLFLWIT